jgi:hypothetical protein
MNKIYNLIFPLHLLTSLDDILPNQLSIIIQYINLIESNTLFKINNNFQGYIFP